MNSTAQQAIAIRQSQGVRDTSWITSAICAATAVMAISTAICVKGLPAKLGLGFLTTAAAGYGLFVRNQYHHGRFEVEMAESGYRQGWKEQMVKLFAPTDANQEAFVEAELVDEADYQALLDDPFMIGTANTTDPTAKSICLALTNLGMACYCDRIDRGLAFDRFYLTPDRGIKFAGIKDKAKDLMVAAGFEQEPNITVVSGAIAVDVARGDRKFANYQDFITDDIRPGCQVPVGVNQLSGELVYLDFADPNSCHQLIAGTTGSGKSEALATQVQYVLDHYPDVKLLLVDVKMSTFGRFKGNPNVTLIESASHGAIAISKVVSKMQERRNQREGFKDVESYNAQADKPINRILVYVEEVQDMIDGLQILTPDELEAMSGEISQAFDSEVVIGSGKGAMSPKDVLVLMLGRIGQAGRSENINLTLITQEPDKRMLDKLIGNLPAKIGLRLNSYVESNVILPGKDAHCERLLGKGDLMYSVPGKPLQRLQSLFLG